MQRLLGTDTAPETKTIKMVRFKKVLIYWPIYIPTIYVWH